MLSMWDGTVRVDRSYDACTVMRTLLPKGSAGECAGGWCGVTVPPALILHESTEHYTLQQILDAVIDCMVEINLDPCSNSREIPLPLQMRKFQPLRGFEDRNFSKLNSES